MELKIKKAGPIAFMPTKATVGSSGYDLYAAESGFVKFGEITIIDTGLSMEIPPGYEVQIRPRSGWAAKHGITVVNSPGTIDADFRGIVKVVLTKHQDDQRGGFHINIGDRIAQMVVQQVPEVTLVEAKELTDTVRGEGGFGSTGVK